MDAVHIHTFGFKPLSHITPFHESFDAVSPCILTGHFQRDSKSVEAKAVLALKFSRLCTLLSLKTVQVGNTGDVSQQPSSQYMKLNKDSRFLQDLRKP